MRSNTFSLPMTTADGILGKVMAFGLHRGAHRDAQVVQEGVPQELFLGIIFTGYNTAKAESRTPIGPSDRKFIDLCMNTLSIASNFP